MGDTLDPIHQLQIDYGYVIQEPEYVTDTTGALIYSHDKNVWLLVIKLTLDLTFSVLIFKLLTSTVKG